MKKKEQIKLVVMRKMIKKISKLSRNKHKIKVIRNKIWRKFNKQWKKDKSNQKE